MPQFRVLYADSSAASKQAELALREAKLDFHANLIQDAKRDGKPVPRLLTSEGFFEGVDTILWYARVYGNGGTQS